MAAVVIAAVVAVIIGMVLVYLGPKSKGTLRNELYEQLSKCEKLASGDQSEKRDSLIRFDTLLGKSLKYAGQRGETTGELLKSARKMFKKEDYDGIWFAHKLRNQIVHESRELRSADLSKAVKYFKLAIRRLLK